MATASDHQKSVNQWAWFAAGLVILLVLSQTEPKLAGGLVLLIVVYLAVKKLAPMLAQPTPHGSSGTF